LLYKLAYASKIGKEVNLELMTMIVSFCQYQFVTSTITSMFGNPKLSRKVTEKESRTVLHD